MTTSGRFPNAIVVIAALLASAGVACAGEAGSGKDSSAYLENQAAVSDATPGSPGSADESYGVAVTPAVYFVNFLLLYIANPSEAANMPAYMASLPPQVYDCLEATPQGCTYADYASLFGFHRSEDPNKRPLWPTACREDPEWERLSPSIARFPNQLNEPLGAERAGRLARLLGIDDSMILTDAQYQCTIGTEPRNPDQEIIVGCIDNLTNSKGNSDNPLSSYGLSVTDQGEVQSLCAPQAVCLVFNNLFKGPLEKIALQCGWAGKLERMVTQTPFLQFVYHGNKCQKAGGAPMGACLVKPASRSASTFPSAFN
jgi:hypothetical protein